MPITLFFGGIYLGFFERSGKGRKSLQRIQWAFGAIALLLSLTFLQVLQRPGMDWEPYTPQKLEAARIASVPVIMDFYADWCVPCLELDRLTFTDAEVIGAAEDFVKLKVDLTHYESAEKLRRKFKIIGVPTIIFLGPDGDEVQGTRVIGYLPPDGFIERIKPVIRISYF